MNKLFLPLAATLMFLIPVLVSAQSRPPVKALECRSEKELTEAALYLQATPQGPRLFAYINDYDMTTAQIENGIPRPMSCTANKGIVTCTGEWLQRQSQPFRRKGEPVQALFLVTDGRGAQPALKFNRSLQSPGKAGEQVIPCRSLIQFPIRLN